MLVVEISEDSHTKELGTLLPANPVVAFRASERTQPDFSYTEVTVGLAREQAALFALMFAALVALLKPAAANCAGVAIETLLTVKVASCKQLFAPVMVNMRQPPGGSTCCVPMVRLSYTIEDPAKGPNCAKGP